MLKTIRKALQNHFLSTDIQARAFDSFYKELLESSYFFYSRQIQNHTTPSYNLLSSIERDKLIEYLSTLGGSFLDYGCGLSFVSEYLNNQTQMIGLDFSPYAIKYNRQNYPHRKFQLAHLNLMPPESYDHILINDAFYHLGHPLRHLNQLLKRNPKSIYWVHNFKEQQGEFVIKGYQVETTDFTQEFKKLVNSWLSVIESSAVQEERKIYPLIWDTLEKEMKAHKAALKDQRIQRLHILIKKL